MLRTGGWSGYSTIRARFTEITLDAGEMQIWDSGAVMQTGRGKFELDAESARYFKLSAKGTGLYLERADSFAAGELAPGIPAAAFPAQTLVSAGITRFTTAAALADSLKAIGVNGLPKWQSICLGLDPNGAPAEMLCDIAPEGSGEMALWLKDVVVPENVTGVGVVATLLRKSEGGAWTAVDTKRIASGEVKFVVDVDEEETALFKVSLSFAPSEM